MNKREIDIALKKISQGDEASFEKLYVETKGGVYAFLYSYFSNGADCEDAMQTTYLKIKQNVSQYQVGTNGLAWILQVAKNTALNELRKKANLEKRQSDFLPSEQNKIESVETKECLTAIMKKILDGEEQRIVILKVVWGYRHKEIAKIMNCPIGTVTSKYKRATEKLKKAWEEESL